MNSTSFRQPLLSSTAIALDYKIINMAGINLESNNVLINMAGDQQPHDTCPAVSTLAEMGLNAKLINPSGDMSVSSTDIDDRFNILSKRSTMMVYLAISPELSNSMVDSEGIINAIPVSTLMPRFDKTILSNSPVQSTLTLCYHVSERHVVSLQQDKLYILEAQLNPHAQQVRDGQGCFNTLNRIFEIPQMQIEEGRVFRFNSLEVNSMAIWEVVNSDGANNVYGNIFTRYRWASGHLWSFNTLVNLNSLDTDRQPTMISIIMALEYCGTQCINVFPRTGRPRSTVYSTSWTAIGSTLAAGWTSTECDTLESRINATSEELINTHRSFNRRMDSIGWTIWPRSTSGANTAANSTPRRMTLA